MSPSQIICRLGFKAFDIHELLPHFVALRTGIYDELGLRVELSDITFVPEKALPPGLFSAACGSVLLSAFQGGARKVLLVAVDSPMFWLMGGGGVTSVRDLDGRRIATFPEAAPPAAMLKVILRSLDIDLYNRVRLESVRDDTARLGLLRSGDAGAAVISSAQAFSTSATKGLNELFFFGDRLRIPTSGLSADSVWVAQHPEPARRMVHAHALALGRICDPGYDLTPVLGELAGLCRDDAERASGQLRRWFRRDGRTSKEIGDRAIEAVAAEAGITSLPKMEEVYDFSLLPTA